LEIGKWTHVAATIDKSGMGKLSLFCHSREG
jgi:hypothetical protein